MLLLPNYWAARLAQTTGDLSQYSRCETLFSFVTQLQVCSNIFSDIFFPDKTAIDQFVSHRSEMVT